MSEAEIQVINIYRNYFVRNKDNSKIISILKENRERTLFLNTRHNILEIRFSTGKVFKVKGVKAYQEQTDVDWFGMSYEILDILFEKYKNNKQALIKFAKFCLNSKSKTYWLKLRDTPIAQEIMAAMLGSVDA